ncbi:MAG: hypothetical protein CM1200mP36_02970 [Gammaproteobacteria bacterium]|nr:MAG: hypothetical protein CM1200mP36_02970 [Gammaproteobacteria bacterium]
MRGSVSFLKGGNTGYCGGATAFDEVAQIVMNLSRMNRVQGVDPVNFAMTVEAGAVLTEVHAAAHEHDLMFPLSMGSQGSCQIGGVCRPTRAVFRLCATALRAIWS